MRVANGPRIGSHVWLRAPPQCSEPFELGRISRIAGTKCSIVTEDEETERWVRVDDLLPANREEPAGGRGDHCSLLHLNEACLLHNSQQRYAAQKIYTAAGSIIVAINPFQPLDIYGEGAMKAYASMGRSSEGPLEPHVYAVAEAAYRRLKHDRHSQAVIVSGESGAGKTETNRHLIDYLTWRACGAGQQQLQDLAHAIMQSNPVLEALGNACTVHNNNSSRFGKFVSLRFGRDGTLLGAQVTSYLLEKSRITSISSPERNFHIFYQMVAGATHEQQQAWKLEGSPTAYHYLAQSSCVALPGVDDAANLNEVLEATRAIGMSTEVQHSLLNLLAALLHLGNISFSGDHDQAQLQAVQAVEALRITHQLLGFPDGAGDSSADLQNLLLVREVQTPLEAVQVKVGTKQAVRTRDSLARAVYASVFGWVVSHANHCIGGGAMPSDAQLTVHMKDTSGDSKATNQLSIGLLDVFGFENFAVNSFEQLCVNYANEKLQAAFLRTVFVMEEDLHHREGVRWRPRAYHDNSGCIALLEKHPNGILRLLDTQCKTPQASDGTFCALVNSTHPGHPFLLPMRASASNGFVVRHFCGDVHYHANADGASTGGVALFGGNWLAKNNDTLPPTFHAFLVASQNPVLQALFQAPASGQGAPLAQAGFTSVGRRFINDLNGLMRHVESTRTHFVRCIKPNGAALPSKFDARRVLQQLRCSGLLEAVSLMKHSFPTRMPYEDLYDMFKDQVPAAIAQLPPAAFCQAVALACELPETDFALGHTMLFLKVGAAYNLEQLTYMQLEEAVPLLVEKLAKWQERQEVLRKAAVVIGRHARGHACWQRLKYQQWASRRIQAVARGGQTRMLLHKMWVERCVVLIQRKYRDYKQHRQGANHAHEAWDEVLEGLGLFDGLEHLQQEPSEHLSEEGDAGGDMAMAMDSLGLFEGLEHLGDEDAKAGHEDPGEDGMAGLFEGLEHLMEEHVEDDGQPPLTGEEGATPIATRQVIAEANQAPTTQPKPAVQGSVGRKLQYKSKPFWETEAQRKAARQQREQQENADPARTTPPQHVQETVLTQDSSPPRIRHAPVPTAQIGGRVSCLPEKAPGVEAAHYEHYEQQFRWLNQMEESVEEEWGVEFAGPDQGSEQPALFDVELQRDPDTGTLGVRLECWDGNSTVGLVEPGGTAELEGSLQQGDIIEGVNGKWCADMTSVLQAMVEADSSVILSVRRNPVLLLLEDTLLMRTRGVGGGGADAWEPFHFQLFSIREMSFEKQTAPYYTGKINVQHAQSLELVHQGVMSNAVLYIHTTQRVWAVHSEDPEVLRRWQHQLQDFMSQQPEAEVHKAGWLHILEGQHAVQRWFVLYSSDQWHMYESPDSAPEHTLGSINLGSVTDINVDVSPEGGVQLRVVSPQEHWTLAAMRGAAQEVHSWARELQAGMSRAVLCQGWVELQLASGGWVPRFLQLSMTTGLQWFENNSHRGASGKSALPEGRLALGEVQEARRSQGLDFYQWCIDIVTQDGSGLRLRPSNKREMQTWLSSLNACCLPATAEATMNGEMTGDGMADEHLALSAQSDLGGGVIETCKSGWLNKRDGKLLGRSWKRRFFKLQQEVVEATGVHGKRVHQRWLVHFASEADARRTDPNIGQYLLLSDGAVVTHKARPGGTKACLEFTVTCRAATWQLSSKDEITSRAWVEALQEEALQEEGRASDESEISTATHCQGPEAVPVVQGWMEMIEIANPPQWGVHFFVVFSDSTLRRYEDESINTEEGRLRLNSQVKLCPMLNPPYNYEHSFEVRAPDTKWVLCPDGMQETEEWMKLLRQYSSQS